MAVIDTYFTEEDAHHVRPLLRFLDLQDLELRAHDCFSPPQSAPFLVILSEHAPAARWLQSLLQQPDAIAVQLTEQPLPGGVRTMDLRSWPARSADRTLAALAQWLNQPDSAQPAALKRVSEDPATGSARRQNLGAILVLLTVAAAIIWSLTLEPAPIGGEDKDERATETTAGLPTATTPPDSSALPSSSDGTQDPRGGTRQDSSSEMRHQDPLTSALDGVLHPLEPAASKAAPPRAFALLDPLRQLRCRHQLAGFQPARQCWVPVRDRRGSAVRHSPAWPPTVSVETGSALASSPAPR